MSNPSDLLDELYRLVDTAKKLPLTDMVLLEQEKVRDLIKEIKINLPLDNDNVIELKNTSEERKDESNQTDAFSVDQLISQEEIVKEANILAEKILEDAKKEANFYVESTLEWVDARFRDLEEFLYKNMEATSVGRKELQRFKTNNS